VTTRRHAYCSFCGYPFADEAPWPRVCAHCDNITYRNPLPVSVIVQPVDDGLLVARRAIEPAKGELALPGGFVELPETWREAGARELLEETGVAVDPAALEVVDVYSAPDGTLLIFGLAPPLTAADLPPFRPGDESSERVILREPADLAFPYHTRVVAAYFAARRASGQQPFP